jgi:hypothetical protein
MGWRMRQIGMVIGLTVILTFPVTVFSRTESPTQLHHVVAAIGGKHSEMAGPHMGIRWPDRQPANDGPVMHATAQRTHGQAGR